MSGETTEAESIASIKQKMREALDFIDEREYSKARCSISQAYGEFDVFMSQLAVELSELRRCERN